MKITDLREAVGKFGEIKAGEKGYKKTTQGRILYVDSLGCVLFVGTEDVGYKFKPSEVDYFEPMEQKEKTS